MAVTVNAAVYGIGVYGTARYGRVVVSNLDQVEATGAVNSVLVNVKEKISGVSATGSVTAVAINGFEIDISERLDSVSATGFVTAVSVNVVEKISGVFSTISIGTPSIYSVNRVFVLGVSATGSAGTVRVNITEKTEGVSATVYAGSLTLHTTAGLTSVGLTSAVGNVVLNASSKITLVSVGLTGYVKETSFNTLEIDVSEKILEGVLVSSYVGAPKLNLSFLLSSVAGTINSGSLGTTAVVFDFEAVKENYSRQRTAYVARVI